MRGRVEGLVRAGEWGGAFAIAAITVIVIFDVFARALGSPTLWAFEITGYLMAGAAVLGAGNVALLGEHFEVRLFLDWLPVRMVRIVDLFTMTLTTLFVLAVTWGAIGFIAQSLELGFRSPTLLQVPMYWPQSLVLLGLLLLSAASVIRLIRRIYAWRRA